MHFIPDKKKSFLEIFNASKNKIRNSPGCSYLMLLEDINDPFHLITFSKWANEDYLEKYRASELFRKTWAKTKILFDQKPIARSFIELIG